MSAPSVWSTAIGLELGFESLGITGNKVRFYCLDCLAQKDPKGKAGVYNAPMATECMACTAPREPVVCVLFFAKDVADG